MIQELLSKVANEGFVVGLVSVLVAFNLILSGLSKVLDVFKDKTATQIDNKAYKLINQAIVLIQKLIDWMSGNRQHKPVVK
jgi:hypothetical protein